MSERTSYSLEFKLKILEYAKGLGNREAARKFGINESAIRRWKKMDTTPKVPTRTAKYYNNKRKSFDLLAFLDKVADEKKSADPATEIEEERDSYSPVKRPKRSRESFANAKKKPADAATDIEEERDSSSPVKSAKRRKSFANAKKKPADPATDIEEERDSTSPMKSAKRRKSFASAKKKPAELATDIEEERDSSSPVRRESFANAKNEEKSADPATEFEEERDSPSPVKRAKRGESFASAVRKALLRKSFASAKKEEKSADPATENEEEGHSSSPMRTAKRKESFASAKKQSADLATEIEKERDSSSPVKRVKRGESFANAKKTPADPATDIEEERDSSSRVQRESFANAKSEEKSADPVIEIEEKRDSSSPVRRESCASSKKKPADPATDIEEERNSTSPVRKESVANEKKKSAYLETENEESDSSSPVRRARRRERFANAKKMKKSEVQTSNKFDEAVPGSASVLSNKEDPKTLAAEKNKHAAEERNEESEVEFPYPSKQPNPVRRLFDKSEEDMESGFSDGGFISPASGSTQGSHSSVTTNTENPGQSQCSICSQWFLSKSCHYTKVDVSLAGLKRRICQYFEIDMSKVCPNLDGFLRREKYPFCSSCFVRVHDLYRRGEQVRTALTQFYKIRDEIVKTATAGVDSAPEKGSVSHFGLKQIIILKGVTEFENEMKEAKTDAHLHIPNIF